MWLLYLYLVLASLHAVCGENCPIPDPSESMKIEVEPQGNYLVEEKSVLPGTNVTFGCYQGYTFSGAAAVTCQEDGTFNAEENPTCTASADHCKLPVMTGMLLDTIQAWSRDDRSILAAAEVNFQCEFGYTMAGSSYKECHSGGSWSAGGLPTCISIHCELPKSEHLIIDIAAGFTFNEHRIIMPGRANFRCPDNYNLLGPSVGICDKNKWDFSAPPMCDAMFCELPAPHADLMLEVFPVDDLDLVNNRVGAAAKVTYRCVWGSVLEGPVAQVCQRDKTFEPTGSTSCLKHCWLVSVEHLVVSGEPAASYVEGSRSVLAPAQVTFRCQPGYSLIGEDQLSCGSNGKWDGEPPYCKGAAGKRCKLPTVENLVVEMYEEYEHDNITIESPSRVRFRCDFGYELVGVPYGECMSHGSWSPPVPQCLELRSFYQRDAPGYPGNHVSDTAPAGCLITLGLLTALMIQQLS